MRRIAGRSILVVAVMTPLLLKIGISQADDASNNIRVMTQAARSLKFADPQNKAYLLEKQETVVAPVAIFFGYLDNRTACQQIADILSASGRAGTFRCHPIYQ